MRCRYLCALVVSLVLFAGCRQQQKTPPLFRLLTPDQTGVRFANTITTTDSENVQTDVYVYNGAGVAIGDIDNDGLPDIFFSGNMVSSRLYLNKGNMRFEDITQAAGVGTKRWATGASMVDINNDGYLDIYVSVSGPEWSNGTDRANLLFINNGNRTFTEAATCFCSTIHPRILRGRKRPSTPRVSGARAPAVTISSIGTTATERSRTCPSKPASCDRSVMDSAWPSPTSTGMGDPTSTFRTTSRPTMSSTSTTAMARSPTRPRDGSSTPASRGWGSTSPTSTTTAGPTLFRST